MMYKLAQSNDMGELAMIKSLLEGSGIPYVVHHEHVSSLYPGVPVMSSRILVDESQMARAETLLSRLRLEIRETPEST